MKCSICKNGKTKPGNSTFMLERDDRFIIFKSVPAEICDTCSEKYFDESVTSRLLNEAEDAFQNGVRIDIRDFSAA